MSTIAALDPILHQPVRSRIIALFLRHGEVSFSALKKHLDITDGNLDAHLRKLATAGYLHSRMTLDNRGRRPHTLYSLSKSGRKATTHYINTLQTLFKMTHHVDA